MRVEVYLNLHKNLWSIRSLEGHNRGRVIGHIDQLILRNCQFIVQPGGQKRTRRTGQKNVHAFVRGHIDGYDLPFPTNNHRVTYNPFRDNSFITTETRDPVHTADRVFFQIANHIPAVAAINPQSLKV